jgi:Fis family transcriptional regulator
VAVYEMVIRSVERPMLEVVLRQAGGNQTLAAEILGINRNTLRKKLVDHKLIPEPTPLLLQPCFQLPVPP